MFTLYLFISFLYQLINWFFIRLLFIYLFTYNLFILTNPSRAKSYTLLPCFRYPSGAAQWSRSAATAPEFASSTAATEGYQAGIWYATCAYLVPPLTRTACLTLSTRSRSTTLTPIPAGWGSPFLCRRRRGRGEDEAFQLGIAAGVTVVIRGEIQVVCGWSTGGERLIVKNCSYSYGCYGRHS